jgi:hypothetical protein
MKLTRNFVLPLAALFFGLLIAPRSAQAQVLDCPPEPKQNVAIASGNVYSGANCTLYTAGDVDSFVFTGNSGDIWQPVLGYVSGATSMCLTLYNPSQAQIFNGCMNIGFGGDSVVTSLELATGGTYTIVVTEDGQAPADSYALSLERLYPAPPDAKPIALSQSVSGEVTPQTDQNLFTFYGATTGTYQASATYTGLGTSQCVTAYNPDGTLAKTSSGSNPGCANIAFGGNTVTFDFTPDENGTILLLVAADGNDGTVSYNLEATCLLGTCPTKVPTTTTLTSSPNPSGDGQAVTFTAEVSSSDGTPPNGETVSFMSGTKLLGTGTLSSGAATFSDSKLSAGATTSVTAVYAGDSTFLTSTSNVVKQMVYGPCTVIDSLSYNATSKTLTMNFTVGNIVATTWNAWLTYQNTLEELFSVAQPITNPPVPVTKTTTLSKEGTVGVLSTLTTATNGIYCSSYVQINTGTP